MKSILDLLKEQKSMTELAIARMKEAEAAYNKQSIEVPYPSEGTPEERIAYCDEYERLKDKKDNAFKAAARRLVSYGEFLGCKVDKKDIEYDWRIEGCYNDLAYYADRLEKTFAYNVESYNSYK